MIFNEKNTEIVSVNYNTPDFIIEQYETIRDKLSEIIKITIIDGSDKKLLIRGKGMITQKEKMYDIAQNDNNFDILRIGYNIHHGPGMDLGVRKNPKKFSLILDSDMSFNSDCVLENLSRLYRKNMVCMGRLVFINKDGFNTNNKNSIKYIHPSFMILDNEKYKNLKNKFIKHGAPCIKIMEEIKDEEKINIPNIMNYVNNKGRGTLNIYGLNIK